jgi:ribonuclease HI
MQPRQDPTPRPGFYVLKSDGGITAEQGQAAGPEAIGVVLKDHKYRDVDEISKQIGWAKNHHEAEYKALIAGLELARGHGIDRIRVFSDSALVVNTVNGDWNLQPEHLKGQQACRLRCRTGPSRARLYAAKQRAFSPSTFSAFGIVMSGDSKPGPTPRRTDLRARTSRAA